MSFKKSNCFGFALSRFSSEERPSSASTHHSLYGPPSVIFNWRHAPREASFLISLLIRFFCHQHRCCISSRVQHNRKHESRVPDGRHARNLMWTELLQRKNKCVCSPTLIHRAGQTATWSELLVLRITGGGRRSSTHFKLKIKKISQQSDHCYSGEKSS